MPEQGEGGLAAHRLLFTDGGTQAPIIGINM